MIGKFGEDTCNASGNKLISLLREVELVACNGRQLVSEPEWTRVRPSLDQKSVIDYILMDEQLMVVSGNVIVDSTDIGCSDHFLVWMEIGRVTKRVKKVKRVHRRWRLERFDDVEVRVTYQKALQAEVLGFTDNSFLPLTTYLYTSRLRFILSFISLSHHLADLPHTIVFSPTTPFATLLTISSHSCTTS